MASSNGISVTLQNSAFQNRVRVYVLRNLEHVDILPFLAACKIVFTVQTQEVLQELANLKVNATLKVKFKRRVPEDENEGSETIGDSDDDEDDMRNPPFYIHSPMKQITPTTNINKWFESNVINVLVNKIDEIQGMGSNLTLHRIFQLDINYNKFNHFSGSSYIPLPKSIKNKRAIVNIKNDDNQCFRWAILSKIHEAKKNVDRLSNYERFKHELKFDDIEFPVAVSDIDKFEMLNPNVSVNVYIMEKERNINSEKYEHMLLPIRLTKNVRSQHVHLLLLFEDDLAENDSDSSDDEDGKRIYKMNVVLRKEKLCNKLLKRHYVWIKNLSALIQNQIVKSNRNKKYICDRCLHYFYSQEKLDAHTTVCEKMNYCKISLPSHENRWLYFENFKNKIEVPFIIYADIESLLMKQNSNEVDMATNIITATPKGVLQRHVPNAVGYYFHSRINLNSSHYDSFVGENCIEKFIERLKELMLFLVWDELHSIKPMKLSVTEKTEFQRATICHICNEKFAKIKADNVDESLSDESDYNSENNHDGGKKNTSFRQMRKVRDHCHLTGRFRGAAHSKCNIKFQVSKSVPIVFHNLDYDSHFLIEKLANAFEGKMTIIPKTSENYISFSKEVPKENFTEKESCDSDVGVDIVKDHRKKYSQKRNHRETLRLRFIDSCKFLQCSLAKLAEGLPSNRLRITRKEWSHLGEEDFRLLTVKGVYPYAYMDSWEKLEETQLPSQADFDDDFNDSKISDEQYSFAKKVWDRFHIKSLREYTNLYLKTDVLLLADIFENFRDNSIKIHELDPAHYLTLPGYSWDCMLKYTKVRVELFTEVDQLLFTERGLRGGIVQCSNRHCEANNQYMGSSYDRTKPTNYLLYLDVNNLYGVPMTQNLPISNYSWYNDLDFNDVEQIKQMILNTSDDSEIGYMLEVDLDYPQHLHDLHNDYPFCSEHICMSDKSKIKKLVLTLYGKLNYVIHYRMLKLALKHGLILKKVHRILKFRQSNWLAKYIMFNSNERTKTNSKFEQDYLKALNNVVAGKLEENVRNRINIVLVNKWIGRYGLEKFIAKPNFTRCIIFNENLVACELQRLNIVINKPIIAGVSVLDISKTIMYSFHYDFMLEHFDPKDCRIQYTDTDSFIYEIKNHNIYEFIKSYPDYFDTSKYEIDNPYGIVPQNRKKLGIMEDENGGRIMSEFIGLRSKMYTYKMHSTVEKTKIVKKAKGVKTCVLNNKIKFEDYKKCILENCTVSQPQMTFRSLYHNVFTLSTMKKALDPKDDKRFIIPQSHATLAWGHYKISTLYNVQPNSSSSIN